MILQLVGLVNLIGGIITAAVSFDDDEDSKIGKVQFWY